MKKSNTKTELLLAKGVRDWYGSDAILRNFIRDTLRNIFERYGFIPLETPPIERLSTLECKGGSEIQKEIFCFSDHGNRKLALRFDHTVPLARYIAMNPKIKLPFKRYTIGEVFRDGPTQPEQGRYRVFTQCDVDIVGIKDVYAEAELVALVSDFFNSIGLGEAIVKVNNRKFLNGLLNMLDISSDKTNEILIMLDKTDKIGIGGVEKELNKILSGGEVSKLINYIKVDLNNKDKIDYFKKNVKSKEGIEGLNELSELIHLVENNNINIIFDPSLARGLDYYTGIVIEVFLKDNTKFKSAVLGGGRYDELIGSFIGNGIEVPAVGLSFGLERLSFVMQKLNLFKEESLIDIYIIPINTLKESFRIAHDLRKEGIRVELELKGRKVSNAISYANFRKIKLVGFIGDEEIRNNKIKIKNFETREQFDVPIEKASSFIKKLSKK